MLQGALIIVSAPSGAGKGSLLKRVRAAMPELAVTVSATTRSPRPGEVDGVDYYFMTQEAFKRLIAQDAFIEWAQVHENLYGTLKAELERHLSAGRTVVLELDVQGMRSVKRLYPKARSIFIAPPTMEELERRLILRGVNNAADMTVRLRNAATEMAAREEFDCVVVNDDIEQAAAELLVLVRGGAPLRVQDSRI